MHKASLRAVGAKMQGTGRLSPSRRCCHYSVKLSCVCVFHFFYISIESLAPYFKSTNAITGDKVQAIAAHRYAAPEHTPLIKRPLAPIVRHRSLHKFTHNALTAPLAFPWRHPQWHRLSKAAHRLATAHTPRPTADRLHHRDP